jgi:DNA processing protein
MNHNNLKYWIALRSIAGIGNIMFTALVDRFGTVEAIFSAEHAELKSVPGITKKSVAAITGFNNWDKVKREIDIIDKTGMDVITYQDDMYPPNLLNVYDRPPFLYVKGTLSKDTVNIAIVGSRLASTYGKYTTEKISRELALRGVTIVSGLARGIDSAAHRGALAAQGRTIAVLGSGLDVIYPPENKILFADIVTNGAVISEFPPGTPPRSANFPARNRIISGISYGVVVVEASEKSGSLITARLALEQGREVFAVPGSIDSVGSRGTNKLIKHGAKLIENTDDILEEILPQLEKVKFNESLPRFSSPPKSINTKKNLSTMDKRIIDAIADNQVHVDDLIIATGFSPADVLRSLMALELDGMVKQSPGKFFSLK